MGEKAQIGDGLCEKDFNSRTPLVSPTEVIKGTIDEVIRLLSYP